MVSDAHCLVFIWDEILQRIHQVQDLRSKYSAEISVEKDLPTELYEKVAELRFFLESIMLNQIADINIEFRASPPLRPYHYRANPVGPNLRIFHVCMIELHEGNVSLKRLLHLREALCDRAARDCFTVHALMDEFERLMQTDSLAKALVSDHMAKSLSRLSI